MDGIKLENASLDEKNGEIIAHGWLSIDAMSALKVDDYQREVLNPSISAKGKKNNLARAISNGVRLPDIMIGMRGENYSSRAGAMILNDPAYIVDGLQRIFSLKTYAEQFPEKAGDLRIGAEVRFNTSKESEKELFRALNLYRTPVSPNVILRNVRDKHPAVLTLYGLSMSDKNSPIYDRVTWTQRMPRGHLFTALMVLRVASNLHHHVLRAGSDSVVTIPTRLDKVADTIGLRVFRQNVLTYFEAVHECYGIRTIQYRESATQTKGNFLISLARLFSDHEDFWDGDNLVIDYAMRKKLKSFPYQDPEIMRLAASGSSAMGILNTLIRNHFNKGKRTKRLTARSADE